MADSYVIDGYRFQTRGDYERAQKERETIAYLEAHADMSDRKAVYKIYRTASEKQSFQTVFGLKYMESLRNSLVASGIVTEDLLDPIPVGRVVVQGKEKKAQLSPADREAAEYRDAYEKIRSRNLIKNLVIAALLIVILGMAVITYNNQYSIFTYFTNYKEKMREELLDEYQEWEDSIQEREDAVESREKELGIAPKEGNEGQADGDSSEKAQGASE